MHNKQELSMRCNLNDFIEVDYLWIPIIYKYLGVHFLFTLNLTGGKLFMWLDSLEKPMLELEPEMKFKKEFVEGKKVCYDFGCCTAIEFYK